MRTILYTLRIGCVALLLGYTSQAMAVDCDCTQLAGSCSASYELRDIRNQAKNSAATLILRSSHATCSKITFFIDNTPHITVLKSGNSSTESLFGTSTIEQNTVSIESCRVCAQAQRKPVTLQDQSSRQFQASLQSQNFDFQSVEASYRQAKSSAAGTTEAFSSVIGGLTSALEAVSQPDQAAQPTKQAQAGEQCWYTYAPNTKRRYAQFPCYTGWYGCEKGPGPNDKMC